MHIRPTTIQAYTFTLTESERLAAIDDPSELVAQLKSAGAEHKNGGGTGEKVKAARKPRRTRTTIAKARKQFKVRRASGRRKAKAAAGLPKRECPECKRMITEKYFDLHTRTKHSGAIAPAAK